MNSYKEYYIESLRLAILDLLNEMGDKTLNSNVLHIGLAGVGFAGVSKAMLLTELNYLAENRAIHLDDIKKDVKICILLLRGQEHVNRQTIIHGVAKPDLMG